MYIHFFEALGIYVSFVTQLHTFHLYDRNTIRSQSDCLLVPQHCQLMDQVLLNGPLCENRVSNFKCVQLEHFYYQSFETE